MNVLYNKKNLKNVRKKLRNKMALHERILWSRLKDKNLGNKFRRQHSIEKYIVDFCCPRKKLIVEIDGSQHYYGEQKDYDEERTKYLNNLGFKVVRFGNHDINNNIEGVISKIREYLS